MIQGIIDAGTIQKMQDAFASLSNICIYCIDGDGHTVTTVSGEKEQSQRLLQLVGRQRLLTLYDRLCSSSIEDQSVEDTEYANLKIAAMAVRIEGKPVLCWLACCVLHPDDVAQGGRLAAGFTAFTREASFYSTLDLMRMWMLQICESHHSQNAAEAENRRNKFSQAEMSRMLQKSECMTRIVQLLMGRDPFEEMAGKYKFLFWGAK